ncbi:hypothetical protein HYPSUDRAFT_114335, partial [Hypholoma sublateritium FD-334 SS-4]
FHVIKLLHNSPVLFGRGTRVWIVRDDAGSFFVLKDSWILAENVVSEIDFVRHIDKTIKEDPDGYLFKNACPSYRIGEECVCSSDTIRGMLTKKPPARHQRRMVTATIGDPITSFRSKREFVAIYLDLVNMLDFLNTKAKVIHGDLSINNILINRLWDYGPDNSPSHLRKLASTKANMRLDPDSASHVVDVSGPVNYGGTLEYIESSGMIIDCDFMRFLHQDTHQTSGTLPFMAIKSLKPTQNNLFRHHAGHDLECLLNTMLTICHYTNGPSGNLRQAITGDEEITLNRWFVTDNRLQLATLKSITLEAFELLILPYLPHYWADFAPFLHRLIEAT